LLYGARAAVIDLLQRRSERRRLRYAL